MEPSAMTHSEERALARHAKMLGDAREVRVSRFSRASHGPPGMGMRHDVLIALIMAVAMAATVFLYR